MTSPFSCVLQSPSLASWSSSREIFPWRISTFSSRHFCRHRHGMEQGRRWGTLASLGRHPSPAPHLLLQHSPQLALQLRLLCLGLRLRSIVLLGEFIQGILQLHHVAGDLPQL